MQCHVKITTLAGIVQDILIELSADMLPAGGFVHAQVVNIERMDTGAQGTFRDLLMFAEDVSQNPVIFIRKDEDRILLDEQFLFQLLAGIFRCGTLKRSGRILWWTMFTCTSRAIRAGMSFVVAGRTVMGMGKLLSGDTGFPG